MAEQALKVNVDKTQTWLQTSAITPLNWNGFRRVSYSDTPVDPFVIPNSTYNTNPEYSNQAITFKCGLNRLIDDSQSKYVKGDILFTFKPHRSKETGSLTLVAIWNLNYYLRMSNIEENRKREDAMQPQQKRPKRQDERYGAYPKTIDQFCNDMFFAGIMLTSSLNIKGIKRTMIALATKGKIEIPNIFKKKDGRAISIGDFAYLLVRSVESTIPVMNINGINHEHETGYQADGTHLIVEGYWNPHSNEPIHSTGVTDCEKVVETVQQRMYERDENGLLDMNRTTTNNDYVVFQDKLEMGLTIKLGRVIRKTKDATDDDIDNALLTYNGWTKLFNYAPIEINLIADNYEIYNKNKN